jgi:hypothetical protein
MSNGPEPQWTKRFTIQISPDLLEEVGRRASLDGISIACFVRRLIINEMPRDTTPLACPERTSDEGHASSNEIR